MPAPTSQAYTTGEAEKQAARNNADLPQLACPLCETKRRVEVVRHGDGALDKIKHLSGPIFVSMGRNKVQKCRCAACPHEWQLTPPPPTGGAAPAAPAAADDDEEVVQSPPKKQQRRHRLTNSLFAVLRTEECSADNSYSTALGYSMVTVRAEAGGNRLTYHCTCTQYRSVSTPPCTNQRRFLDVPVRSSRH